VLDLSMGLRVGAATAAGAGFGVAEEEEEDDDDGEEGEDDDDDGGGDDDDDAGATSPEQPTKKFKLTFRLG
jgi:hypothetical protein